MNVFFTADTHFNHNNIMRYCYRPFSSVTEMDDTMIKNWNLKVEPDDIVYHLGDFAFGDIPFCVDTLFKLNGKIKFIFGNHDKEMRRMQYNANHSLREKIEFVGELKKIYINEQEMILCHYPMMTWEKKKYGTWMLHGHCHYNLPITRKDSDYGKILDVGVDGNEYTPYSFYDLKKIMDTKPINCPLAPFNDHHKQND